MNDEGIVASAFNDFVVTVPFVEEGQGRGGNHIVTAAQRDDLHSLGESDCASRLIVIVQESDSHHFHCSRSLSCLQDNIIRAATPIVRESTPPALHTCPSTNESHSRRPGWWYL